MKVAVGSRTDVGRVRDGNQDSYVARLPLFAVADGMGGHLGGDVASATAIETISSGLQGSDGKVEEAALADVVQRANRAIWDRSQSDPSLRGMGTTCTVLLLQEDDAVVAHVGDSRLYLLREGGFEQLSQDHTLVGQMVREGRLSQEEARHHPQRSVITRALGADPDVRVDAFRLELREGDIVLICSDGLTSMVPDEDIAEVLDTATDPQEAADRLVEIANEAGGEDNITVVVLDTRAEALEAAGAPPPPPDAARPRDRDTGELGPVPGTATAAPESDDGAATATEYRAETPRAWPRRLGIAAGVLIVLAAGCYVGVRYWLDHSWYVSESDSHDVAIYQGVDGSFAGFDLSHIEEDGGLAVSDLPQNLRDNVREGLSATSLADAHRKLDSLRRAAAAYQRQQQRRHHHKKHSGGGGKT